MVQDIKKTLLAVADFYEPEPLQKAPKQESTLTPQASSMAESLWKPESAALQRQITPPLCEDSQEILAIM